LFNSDTNQQLFGDLNVLINFHAIQAYEIDCLYNVLLLVSYSAWRHWRRWYTSIFAGCWRSALLRFVYNVHLICETIRYNGIH